LLKEEYPIN